MKGTYRTPIMLSEIEGDYLGAGYACLNTANEFFKGLYKGTTNERLKEAISQMIANCTVLKSQLDLNLQCNIRFEQVKDDDVMRLFEVIRLYNKLPQEGKDSMEALLTELNNNQTIAVQCL